MKTIAVVLPVVFAFLVGAAPASAWTWPVEGPVIQQFSLGSDPYAGGQHRGIDIGAPSGASVSAPASGLVSFAGSVPGGGRTVTIRTEDGYAVTLVHLGEIAIAEGASIAQGAVVGTVGPSGDAEHAEPYVHLGIRIAADQNGYVDPLLLLPSVGAPPKPPDMAGSPEPSDSVEDGADVASPTPDEIGVPTAVESGAPGPDAEVQAPASPGSQPGEAQTVATASSGQQTTSPQPTNVPSSGVGSPGHAVTDSAVEPPAQSEPLIGEIVGEAGSSPVDVHAGTPDHEVDVGTPDHEADVAAIPPTTMTDHSARVDGATNEDVRSPTTGRSSAREGSEWTLAAGEVSRGYSAQASEGGIGTQTPASAGTGSAAVAASHESDALPGRNRAVRFGLGAAIAAALAGVVLLLLWRPVSGSRPAARGHSFPTRSGGVTSARADASPGGTPSPATTARASTPAALPSIPATSRLVRLRSVERLADAA
jgi:hypothetical protein